MTTVASAITIGVVDLSTGALLESTSNDSDLEEILFKLGAYARHLFDGQILHHLPQIGTGKSTIEGNEDIKEVILINEEVSCVIAKTRQMARVAALFVSSKATHPGMLLFQARSYLASVRNVDSIDKTDHAAAGQHAAAQQKPHFCPIESNSKRFMHILSVIDRTVLPRKITFSTSSQQLTLGVFSRRARFLSEDVEPPAFASRFSVLCSTGEPIRKEIRYWDAVRTSGKDLTVSGIVNAQNLKHFETADQETHLLPQADFSFTSEGWPINMPPAANFSCLETAWKAAIELNQWRTHSGNHFASPLLLLAVSHSPPPREILISAGNGNYVSIVHSSRLGHFLTASSSPKR
jgi:hypothetical protein